MDMIPHNLSDLLYIVIALLGGGAAGWQGGKRKPLPDIFAMERMMNDNRERLVKVEAKVDARI